MYCVYRHFDADDRLLYVGMSINPLRRLEQHGYRAEWKANGFKGGQIVQAMNAADPKLKPMSTASWFNTKTRTLEAFAPKHEPIGKGDGD